MINSDISLTFVFAVLVVFLAVVVFYGFIGLSLDFSRELKQLNREISRTDGDERIYWKRKRRKLWLSLIPFIKY